MMEDNNSTLTIAYMNVRGQTGMDIVKQLQIENFLKFYKIDILHCQEINILQDSFNSCEHVTSLLISFQIMLRISMEPAALFQISTRQKTLKLILTAEYWHSVLEILLSAMFTCILEMMQL